MSERPLDPRPPLSSPSSSKLRPEQPQPQVWPSFKVGIIGLAAMFLLVIGALVFLGTMAKDTAPRTPSRNEPPTIVPAPRLTPASEEDLAALMPEDRARELERELHEWFRAPDRRPITDGDPVDEAEWVAKLLSDDVRTRLNALPPRVYGALDNIPRVFDEPGPYRGTLVQVWGELSAIEEIPLQGQAERKAWLLTIEDPVGLVWTVTATRSPPPGVDPGDWVRVQGVFAKHWPLPDAKRPALHVFAVQEPARSYPPVTIREIDPQWLEQIDDESLEGATRNPAEDRVFWLFMNYVKTLGQEGYRALRDTDRILVHDLTDTMGSTPLADHPDTYRFQVVRLRLAPAYTQSALEEGLPENAGNIRSVYRMFMADDQSRPVQIFTPFDRSAFDLAGNPRVVEVEGYFYRRRAVEKRSGGMYWMPIVIATDIRAGHFPIGQSNNALYLAIFGLGGAGLLLTMFTVLMLRNRRERAEFERRLQTRRKRTAGPLGRVPSAPGGGPDAGATEPADTNPPGGAGTT